MAPRRRSTSASKRSRASLVHEVVVLEPADARPDVGRQGVEGVQPLRGDLAQHPLEVRILRLRSSDLARSRAAVSRLRRGLARGVRLRVEPSLDAGPLRLDDLVELLAHVRQRIRQRALPQELLAPVAQAVEEVAQAAQVAARRVAPPQSALHEPAHGLRHVAVLEHVVRQRVDDLVGREVGHVLRAVPAPVLGGGRQVAVTAGGAHVRPAEVTGIGREEGHGSGSAASVG